MEKSKGPLFSVKFSPADKMIFAVGGEMIGTKLLDLRNTKR